MKRPEGKLLTAMLVVAGLFALSSIRADENDSSNAVPAQVDVAALVERVAALEKRLAELETRNPGVQLVDSRGEQTGEVPVQSVWVPKPAQVASPVEDDSNMERTNGQTWRFQLLGTKPTVKSPRAERVRTAPST